MDTQGSLAPREFKIGKADILPARSEMGVDQQIDYADKAMVYEIQNVYKKILLRVYD